METLSGRQEPEPSPSLLDTKSFSARKRGKRAFHRVMSGLERQGLLRLLTLTTASKVSNETFQKDFRKLRMRLLRRGLFLEYIRCPELTKSGLRHEHILFRGSYIEQAYLSKLWSDIHNSPVVDIRRAWGKRRLANYLASYVTKEMCGRLSWSWGWVWKGFVHSWTLLKKFSREMGWNYKKLLTTWKWCLILDIHPEKELPNEV